MPTTILDGETYEQARHRRFTEEAKVIEKMQQDEIIRMAQEACAPNQTFNSDEEWVKRFAALVAAHEREKPVTVPANGLRQQEPSRSSPTGSQSNEIVPVGYVDAMFQFQTCQEHYVSPSDRFKPVYTAEQIEAAVLAERARMCKQFNTPMELANETATSNEAN